MHTSTCLTQSNRDRGSFTNQAQDMLRSADLTASGADRSRLPTPFGQAERPAMVGPLRRPAIPEKGPSEILDLIGSADRLTTEAADLLDRTKAAVDGEKSRLEMGQKTAIRYRDGFLVLNPIFQEFDRRSAQLDQIKAALEGEAAKLLWSSAQDEAILQLDRATGVGEETRSILRAKRDRDPQFSIHKFIIEEKSFGRLHNLIAIYCDPVGFEMTEDARATLEQYLDERLRYTDSVMEDYLSDAIAAMEHNSIEFEKSFRRIMQPFAKPPQGTTGPLADGWALFEERLEGSRNPAAAA